MNDIHNEGTEIKNYKETNEGIGGRHETTTSKSRQGKEDPNVIVGNSLTKHLDARKLKRSIKKGNQKIFVETYKGANTDAIKHHVRPCLSRKPDRIILHAGSNDLKDKDVKQIVDNIGSICQLNTK